MKTLVLTVSVALVCGLPLFAEERQEAPRVFVANGVYQAKAWTYASAPPEDWAQSEKILWIEYYFPEQHATVVRALTHGLPRLEGKDYAFCFLVDPARYEKKGIYAGSGMHGTAVLKARLMEFTDLELSKLRIAELQRIIVEYAERHKPIEQHYLQELTK